MTRRERIHNAMHFKPVDKVPVRYYCTPVGFYEHGEKLNDLYQTLPDDFAPLPRQPIPVLGPELFDDKGNYHAFQTDAWGVTREFRIFGVQGLPAKYLLQSPEDVAAYRPPAPAPLSGPEYDAFAAQIAERKAQDHYAFVSAGNLYERMIALYGDENVLCDIAMDEPEIHTLADKIVEWNAAHIARAVKAGADGISFGDDYGSERSLLMNPDTWRAFFKPRLKELFRPAVEAGLDIHFHSCGQVMSILPDLKEIGVTSIWPQLPAYNMEELAAFCRTLGLAVEVHTDRARTMTFGTPQEVRELVKREFDTFKMADGGAWFYIEADNGFPFANLEALVETIRELRA